MRTAVIGDSTLTNLKTLHRQKYIDVLKIKQALLLLV